MARVGERVKYWSDAHLQWVDASVLMVIRFAARKSYGMVGVFADTTPIDRGLVVIFIQNGDARAGRLPTTRWIYGIYGVVWPS